METCFKIILDGRHGFCDYLLLLSVKYQNCSIHWEHDVDCIQEPLFIGYFRVGSVCVQKDNMAECAYPSLLLVKVMDFG